MRAFDSRRNRPSHATPSTVVLRSGEGKVGKAFIMHERNAVNGVPEVVPRSGYRPRRFPRRAP